MIVPAPPPVVFPLRPERISQVQLTRREVQLAALVAAGMLNKEIAYNLVLSEGTVKVYLSHLYAKMGLRNRADLAAWWTRSTPAQAA